MEQSISQGSQSFEQDIARLIASGAINQQEGIAHADSPSNLMWRLQNSGESPLLTPSQARGVHPNSDTGPITLMLDP
jgi:twitching motility protein PilU